MTNIATFKSIGKMVFFVATVLITGLIIVGCAGSNGGGLRKSNEVNQFFLSRQIYADHQYYFFPPRNNPTAIIAIHKDFVVSSRVWNSIDITPDIMNRWIRNMTNNRLRTDGIWGRRIVGPGGEIIGYWFSRERISGVSLSGKVVTIPAPRRRTTESQ